ncbi:MAG: GTP-binding protein [Planctomycetota bacterium]|jgi:signal recognition particle receptor subunit beta
MVQINFALKEVNCKIVYYGPGMSGKTTNLEIVHQKAPENNKGDLTSISTDGDRTLFFDFMPLDLGTVAGMRTKFQLYTVPGQVYYNSTRKLVLQGCDGVIFIADSDPEKMAENIESYDNLIENLQEYGKDIRELPHVLQYNKRDLPNALPVDEIDKQLNRFGVPTFEAVANTGEGVFPTLKTLAGMVLESIDRMDHRRGRGASAPASSAGSGSGSGSASTAGAASSGPAPSGTAHVGVAPGATPSGAPPSGSVPSSTAPGGSTMGAGSSSRPASGRRDAVEKPSGTRRAPVRKAAPRRGQPSSRRPARALTGSGRRAPPPRRRGPTPATAAARPRGRPAGARSVSARPLPRKAVVHAKQQGVVAKNSSMSLMVALVVLLAVAVAGVVFFMLSGGF